MTGQGPRPQDRDWLPAWPPIIGALLGHKHATTTARYAHLSADPLRAANDAVGARIAAAMNRRPEAVPRDDVENIPPRRGGARRASNE